LTLCVSCEYRFRLPESILVSVCAGKFFQSRAIFIIRKLYYQDIKDWGMAQWLQPLLDVIFDGVADTVDYQLKELLPSKFCNKYYYRFQTDKLEPDSAIDDASYRNIQFLKNLAQTIIEKQDRDLEELCQQLIGLQPS
jgi:uncharacterized protein